MYRAINELDKKLVGNFKPFNKQNGFFIEAGANNGILQSNTFYFENELNWTGILVEPVPVVYEQCKTNRPNAIVVNAALVADDYNLKEIVIEYTPQTHGLMSTIKGLRTTKHHLKKSGDLEGHQGLIVPALTLNQILEQNKQYLPKTIDLLVLDVEGYEPSALKGIDFKKWKIDYILIEQQYNSTEIKTILQQNYNAVAQLSDHDYLWKRK